MNTNARRSAGRGRATGTTRRRRSCSSATPCPSARNRVLPSGSRSGYVVIRATRGGCPATGVAWSSMPTGGRQAKGDACSRLVPGHQDDVIRRFRPALVIWWSRYELAERLASDGYAARRWAHMRTGARSGNRSRSRIAALTGSERSVVTVQVERSWQRDAGTARDLGRCGPFIRRLDPPTPTCRTRGTRSSQRGSPDLRCARSRSSASCATTLASPCDDRLPDGNLARHDGSHYAPEEAVGIARTIVSRALEAAAPGVANRAGEKAHDHPRMGREGFEPSTLGLRVPCSTN